MTDNATIAALADRMPAGDIEKDMLRIFDALENIKRAAVEIEFFELRDTLKHRHTWRGAPKHPAPMTPVW
jgi:hypothetical protein